MTAALQMMQIPPSGTASPKLPLHQRVPRRAALELVSQSTRSHESAGGSAPMRPAAVARPCRSYRPRSPGVSQSLTLPLPASRSILVRSSQVTSTVHSPVPTSTALPSLRMQSAQVLALILTDEVGADTIRESHPDFPFAGCR